MSSLARRVAPHLAALLTSSRTRDARRWLAEQSRRVRGAPRLVRYFHQVDDPYAQLAAQALRPLVARYDVVLEPHLVGPPSDAAAPERDRLAAFARKDAADVAPWYGLAFPRCDAAADPALVALASRALAGAIAAGSFVEQAPRVGAALWSGDRATLEALAQACRSVGGDAAVRACAAGDALRARLGHYLGATFHHAGEWYWGVDRLEHLERRLRAAGATRPGADPRPIVARPQPCSWEPGPAAPPRVALEFYPSLRSPYSYIAMQRVFALPHRYPIDLRVRPVLPMVMRGLPVPRAKQLYITLDTRREAEDVGVPFGRICDPVGRPVERAFSLWPLARERGREQEYLLAFARAAFAEGVDTGTDAGLRHVIERAGLSFAEARPRLDGEGWRPELERNREQLFALGLWGVPSFRILGAGGAPDFCTWGQDRIWLVEAELRRRLGAAAP